MNDTTELERRLRFAAQWPHGELTPLLTEAADALEAARKRIDHAWVADIIGTSLRVNTNTHPPTVGVLIGDFPADWIGQRVRVVREGQ